MAPFLFFLFFALIVALAIWGGVTAARKARERQEALFALSQKLGLSFDPNDSSMWNRYTHFGHFDRGHSRRMYNTLLGYLDAGPHKISIQAGDYQYKTEQGSGKNRRTVTHRFSYLVARPPFAFRQQLNVRREGLFDKIASVMGFEDIDFESAEFSKKFMVKCDDKKFAYDLIEPRMMQWFLDSPPPEFVTAGGELLIMTGGNWTPEVFQQNIAWMSEFISRWPRHLVDSLKAGTR
jgi:hypothetical protein